MHTTPKYLEIVKSRGERRLELKRVYRNLQNKELFLTAYSRIYENTGAVTRGIDPTDTVDGMSLKKIEKIIDRLKNGKYKWKPARRIYIPKSNGKLRPISIPGWSDKLLQKVIEMVLCTYYEPQFYNNSHGFRPVRGCHTALEEIVYKWQGMKWFIELDIRGCFDNINQEKLLTIIEKNIKDNRLLKLIKKMTKAGYINNFKYERTYSGVPQGGILSPLLSNIYLNELDKFIIEKLMHKYNRKKSRRSNSKYTKLTDKIKIAKKNKNYKQYKVLKKQRNTLPTGDPQDADYRRLKYIRYADDALLGFIGTKAEAETIKTEIGKFLKEELGLEMSEEKTFITHATEGKARFLGYNISMARCNSKKCNGNRSVNGQPTLQVPPEITKEWIRKVSRNGKPHQRRELLNRSDYDIVYTYNAEFQGLANYYIMAQNLAMEMYKLKYVYTQSLVKTLSNKHNVKVTRIYKKHCKVFDTGVKGLEVRVKREGKTPLIARFGSKPIKRKKRTTIKDEIRVVKIGRNEILKRLLNDVCEICGHKGNIEMHHIRKLKDLKRRYRGRKPPPKWVTQMIAINRKTLPVCKGCHRKIHNGTLN